MVNVGKRKYLKNGMKWAEWVMSNHLPFSAIEKLRETVSTYFIISFLGDGLFITNIYTHMFIWKLFHVTYFSFSSY